MEKYTSYICWNRCGQLAPVGKGNSFLLHKWTEHFTLSEWSQDARLNGSGKRVEKLFIGALKKEKEKHNRYKLKEAMAIAIGLI